MTTELWQAKKIVDSTLHPGGAHSISYTREFCQAIGLTDCSSDTGEPVLLPFRMSCFVISNLIVTAGMLTPNLKVRLPLLL